MEPDRKDKNKKKYQYCKRKGQTSKNSMRVLNNPQNSEPEFKNSQKKQENRNRNLLNKRDRLETIENESIMKEEKIFENVNKITCKETEKLEGLSVIEIFKRKEALFESELEDLKIQIENLYEKHKNSDLPDKNEIEEEIFKLKESFKNFSQRFQILKGFYQKFYELEEKLTNQKL